jgi:hypothetical protein
MCLIKIFTPYNPSDSNSFQMNLKSLTIFDVLDTLRNDNGQKFYRVNLDNAVSLFDQETGINQTRKLHFKVINRHEISFLN